MGFSLPPAVSGDSFALQGFLMSMVLTLGGYKRLEWFVSYGECMQSWLSLCCTIVMR